MNFVERDYDFGNYLSELRKSRGLSQYQLGRLLGVSDKTVSKWENGGADMPETGWTIVPVKF